MQPGSHGRLAYDIRAQVPGLTTFGRDASNGYFTKKELYAITRHLEIDTYDLINEIYDEYGATKICTRHLRWAILREAGASMTIKSHPRDYDESFTKGQKHAVLTAVSEVDA